MRIKRTSLLPPARHDAGASPTQSRLSLLFWSVATALGSLFGWSDSFGATVLPAAQVLSYADGRPAAKYRLDAQDAGVVLRHGDGPNRCDYLGARDVWVWQSGTSFFMHYDGAGPGAWLASLATSTDLTNWTKLGPVLGLGGANDDDSASASYGTTFFDGTRWHMFYVATRFVTPAPDFIPATPYLTMKAIGHSPFGPWTKQPQVVPFRCQPGTYFSDTASPGYIVRQRGKYLMFFSAAKNSDGLLRRTLGIARTRNLDAAWTPDPQPILPPAEQIENSSLYFEPAHHTWFLFCNHVGLENNAEFTDAVWAYWSRDLNHWHAGDKAVVLDGSNCRWSRKCIGLPSVLKVGRRLALFYDAPGGESTSHMHRDVGLAWLDLPLTPPDPSASAAVTPPPAAESMADPSTYLAPIVAELERSWPSNRTVNLVCHGHSVPAGYFKTPAVDSLDAYPNQLRCALAARFPRAVINVIVTARGGENSVQGAARFEADVLTHKPDVVFIDYALNDRPVGLEKAAAAWVSMIQKAQAAGAKVILLTPTPDTSAKLDDPTDPLNRHAAQIRRLAAQFHVGLVDSLALFKAELARGAPLTSLMAQVNHPNAAGHKLVAVELLKWFPPP